MKSRSIKVKNDGSKYNFMMLNEYIGKKAKKP